MGIRYQKEKRIFTLETAHTSYQMMVDEYGVLLHLYYGPKVYSDMDYLLTRYDRGFSGNLYDAGADRTYSLDVQPLEYPVWGVGDYRSSALIIRNADESECCDLRYVRHEIQKGKYALEGLPAVFSADREAETLVVILEDPVSGIQAELLYGVLEQGDILTRSVRIRNTGNQTAAVEKAASACLELNSGEYDLIDFCGRHTMERNMQRSRISYGKREIGSRRGTSSHQHNPAVILAEPGTTEETGGCWGLMFVYSGSFQCEVEKSQYGQIRVLMGLQEEQFHYPLNPGEELTLPETILCYSHQGFSALSHRFHACIREHLCRGAYARRSRPVLVNSWEAAYFDFDGETICNLAQEAAELGIDMVVMDDGWFGKRDDDNSGLGDWTVNEAKLGCTLGELIQRVNRLGVRFGIWIEPEMVSEDSDLYRAHPDWALQIPGRKPVRSRNQLTLDFSRSDVRSFLFEKICQVLDQGNIEYVKWDMNRSLADVYSAETLPGKTAYAYVLGVYEFLEKLMQRYPRLLIEGCSGGGGRFDAGMLYYTPQIWCSDNTDAIDRLKIQYGTSFFYPLSTMGSHVSAVPNHQTGRSVSLHTRGITAMTGAFGYELNLSHLSTEEKSIIREQIRQYHQYEELIARGEYDRLSNPFEDEWTAWQCAAPDRSAVLVSLVMTETHGNMPVSYVKLRGLQPDAQYRNQENGQVYSGAALMYGGLPVPIRKEEYYAEQILLEILEKQDTIENKKR